MSALIELQERIEQANGLLAELERTAIQHPDRRSIRVSFSSMRKHRDTMQLEFLALAEELGVEVCSYRILPSSRLSIQTVAGAWSAFQRLLSMVFDALLTGPKERAAVGEEASTATSLGYAYSFPGSLGVILTLPREQVEQHTERLRLATSTVFAIAGAKSSDDIRAHARTLGVPVVRTAYSWAKAHAANGLGVGIEWRTAGALPIDLLLQRQELERLAETISAMSEVRESTVTLTGHLLAVDTTRRTFKFVPDGAETIAGRFEDAIDDERAVKVPGRYSITMRRRARIEFATDDEKTDYFLLSAPTPA